MKRRPSGLGILAIVLAGCLLTQFTFADGLPNAWQVNSTNSLANYTTNLSDDLQIAATNTTGGFDYTINARLLSGSSSNETIAMAYGLGTNRFLIWFSLNTNGDLTADLDGAATYTLTTNGTGTALYHYHKILFNPATAQASYLFDGRVMTTNWSPTTNSLTNGQVFWGANNSSGAGTMNFHTVAFKITNTVVATYDAGSAPDTAQDPTNAPFGWELSGDSASVTNISADAVPLPTTPLPTTLDATNVAIHQATLLGTGDQGNLAATVWFEWGTDTNYGNTTPPQPLLSDTNNFNLSETITGLAKGTTYHYRCVATNLQGIAYGQDVVFLTPAAITVTNSADTGPGTLRQAIADSGPGGTITFAIEDTNTITLTSGQLLITNNLTIISTNAITIDAGGLSRVLEISASNIVTLDSLTITNGNVSDSGGGILVDSSATLTLTNCTVAGNIADSGGGIFISPNSTVAIQNSTLSANSATNNGGAIDNETNSTLTVSGSLFTANSALRGGAIFNNFGTNLLNSCAFSSNSAANGGAIASFNSALTATSLSVSNNFAAAGGGIFSHNNSILTLNDSTLSRNFATNYGGGILNTNGGTATINNSTISSNACPSDQGGGIDNWSTITVNNCTISMNPSGGGFVNSGGLAMCNNSTFSGNFALFDGGGFYGFFGTNILNNCTISGNAARRRAGGFYENSTTSLLTNTIVAGNTALISDPEILGFISVANSLTNGNPLLAPLGDYGGPTQTMPPLLGSPAINAGIDSVTHLFATDQRGYPRLVGSHVDIGAVETQPTMVLNADDNGPGSLREVASIAPVLITFTNTLSGQTIHLTSGQLTISNSIGIDASGLAGGILIDAGGSSRVLEITASNIVTFNSLMITNGSVPGSGGGILVNSGAILTLTNCTVAGNSADAGGGIFISTNGTVAIQNSSFFANSATNNGGAIDNDTNSTLIVNDSVFTGNSALRGGAIFNNFGTNLLRNCTLSGNFAEDGGAIANLDSVLIATGLSVSNNFAAAGGGFFNLNSNSILILRNSTVSGNLATNNGGGILADGGATLTLTNCTVTGNSSEAGGGIFISTNGIAVIRNSVLSTNSAGTGGAIESHQAVLTLTNCTIAGNNPGGGVALFSGILTVNNSTLSHNTTTQNGGGFSIAGGQATFNNCTLFANSGSNGGGIAIDANVTNVLNNCTLSGNSANTGGGLFQDPASVSILTNTIVAGNIATSAPDIFGPIAGANNLTTGNPLLAPLGNYGGPTQTMPPLAGSPAIDAGLDSAAAALITDQRGFPRKSGAHVDIGAVETQPAMVINANDSGPGSLRAAASIGSEVITFTNTLSGQIIHLTSGQVTLSNSVGIDASSLIGGILIDAGGNSRVLEITAGNIVILDSLTITNGNVPDNGGGILVDDGVTLTLTNSTVAGNSANKGGGIFISTNSSVAIRNSTLSANSATNNGGGIALFFGALTVNNSTISHNTTAQNGGGIAIDTAVINLLNNCTITGNSADTGGGLFQNPGSISLLTNTIIAGNTATTAADIFGPIDGANNLTNGNPLLAPLGNYGGPTQTMPPLAGSPAINTGLDSAASLITDQRGYPRKSGAHVDIGAVEAQLWPANNRPVLHLTRPQPGGAWTLTFTNTPTADFTVLTSTNLGLPLNQWTILGPLIQNAPGLYQFTDPPSTNSKVRFYQVVSP